MRSGAGPPRSSEEIEQVTTRPLGALDSVDPREAWHHEARDFTPWVAENLDRLATATGLELEREGTEVHVGPLRADIVARNPRDDSRVLIENQLESTPTS